MAAGQTNFTFPCEKENLTFTEMSYNDKNCLSGTPAKSNVNLVEDNAASIFRVPASIVRIQPDMLTQVTSDVVITVFDCVLIIRVILILMLPHL